MQSASYARKRKVPPALIAAGIAAMVLATAVLWPFIGDIKDAPTQLFLAMMALFGAGTAAAYIGESKFFSSVQQARPNK